MTATKEQIVAEAHRRQSHRAKENKSYVDHIIEIVREGWTPPEPVDPDLVAYREWEAGKRIQPAYREEVLAGKWDLGRTAAAYLAGARMATERERERAKVLVGFIAGRGVINFPAGAAETLAKYRGEAR